LEQQKEIPMKRRILSTIATAFALTATLSLPASADTLSDVKARGKLIVGVKTDYPPFGFIDPSGKIVGVEVEIAKSIAGKLLGSTEAIELVPVVASNRIEFLQAGRVDLVLATLGVTPERGKVVDFTEYYYMASGTGLMAPINTALTSWESTRGKPICGIQGAYYNKYLIETYGVSLVNFASLPDAYKALQDNRCLGLAFDELSLLTKLTEPDWKSRYKLAVEAYEHIPQAGGVRKNEKPFLDAVNAAILSTEADGKIIAWEAQYGMPPSPYVAERATAAKAKAK
jgi:polar amino acid transport system substrate-binding protein